VSTTCEAPLLAPAKQVSITPSRPSQRLRLAIFALGLLPAVLCVDLGIALWRGWQLESKVDTLVLTLSVAALAMLVVAMLMAPVRRRLSLAWRQCVLLGGVVMASWFAIELALALFLPNVAEGPFHRRSPNLSMVFHPRNDIFPGVSGAARYATNSLGIRGNELPGERSVPRILCLGGSTTECAYLDETETWPSLLMQHLNKTSADTTDTYWVGNAGISGFNSEHHLRFVRESELMDEIDCLVLMVGVNDFSKFVETEKLTAENEQDQALALAREPLWCQSQVRNLARRAANIYLPTMTRHYEDPDGANYQLRRHQRQVAKQVDQLPNLKGALAEYAQRIEQIAKGCRKKDIRLIVVNQPVLWSSELDDEAQGLLWLGRTAHDSFLTPAALRQGMDDHNATLAATCSRLGIEMVDLSYMHGRQEFFYDDCHFTELGAAEVAHRLAAWFDQHPVMAEAR